MKQRYGSIVGIKEEKIAYYEQLHAAPWPSVLKILKHHHVQNYSIYLSKWVDDHHYLFSYLEYTGHDFDADMVLIADEPEIKRWWAECVPCFNLLPDHPPTGFWSPLQEVFHMD